MKLCLLFEADVEHQGDIIGVAENLENALREIPRMGKKKYMGFDFHWNPPGENIRDNAINFKVWVDVGNKRLGERTYNVSIGTGEPGKKKSKEEKWADIMKKVDQAAQSIPLFLAKTIFGVLSKEKRTPHAGPILMAKAEEKGKLVGPQNYPLSANGINDLKLDIWGWAEELVMALAGARKPAGRARPVGL